METNSICFLVNWRPKQISSAPLDLPPNICCGRNPNISLRLWKNLISRSNGEVARIKQKSKWPFIAWSLKFELELGMLFAAVAVNYFMRQSTALLSSLCIGNEAGRTLRPGQDNPLTHAQRPGTKSWPCIEDGAVSEQKWPGSASANGNF